MSKVQFFHFKILLSRKLNLNVSGSGIWKIVNFKKVNNISDKIKKDDGGW